MRNGLVSLSSGAGSTLVYIAAMLRFDPGDQILGKELLKAPAFEAPEHLETVARTATAVNMYVTVLSGIIFVFLSGLVSDTNEFTCVAIVSGLGIDVQFLELFAVFKHLVVRY